MAELIIKDMQLYHEIVNSYSFKTEQLHIDLVAAVNNFHKVQDDIPYHIVFDVKFDLRCKARLVTDGNWTDVIREDIYSS